MIQKATILSLLATLLAVGSISAEPATEVSSKSLARDNTIKTFMDETMSIIDIFREQTTSFTANVTMVRRVAGLTRFVSSDCRVVYRKPDYCAIDVKGVSTYTVLISNRIVFITFPETGERDIRPLDENEQILDDYLGIAGKPPKKTYDFTFKTEKNMYVVQAVMRPDVRRRLTQDIVKNARTAIKRIMWINPRTEKIVKTHVITLGGDDTMYTFREQWINTAVSE